MTPFRILLVGLVLVAGLLYLLNPGPEAFRTFLTEELAQRAEQRARDAGEEVAGRFGRARGRRDRAAPWAGGRRPDLGGV